MKEESNVYDEKNKKEITEENFLKTSINKIIFIMYSYRRHGKRISEQLKITVYAYSITI